MRGTKVVLKVVGALMALGGIALIVSAAMSDSLAKFGLIGAGIGLLFAGVAMVFGGRYVSNVTGGNVKNGVPGQGQVLSVRDTGVTVGGHNMVLAARVSVSGQGISPYETELKMTLGRTQWGAIQPGMVLPVLIDPKDPRKVAYDQSRPVHAAAPGMPAPGATQQVTRSASDVVARGVATHGVLQSVASLGLTAGQVAQGLAPHEADDPVMQITMVYIGPGDAQLTTTIGVRVPDGKAGALVQGATVPVRYLPDDPSVATIDWARV